MDLLLFLLIILSFYTSDFKKIFSLAFAFGLLKDLFFASLVGFSSLSFLITTFIIYLYRRKFSSSNFIFQLIFVLIAYLLFNFFNQEEISGKKILAWLLFSLLIFSLINKIKGKSGNLKLEV